MPHIKNALIRYRIIDKCIRNKYKPFPSKRDLREACEESLFGSMNGTHICDSTIEKDMFSMKMEHDAPIKYSKLEKGYFYEDPDFSINDIPLTEDDLGAISFAAKTLLQFRDVDLFKQFGSAIDKIVGRVEVSQDKGSEEFIQFEKSISDSGNEYLSPLLESIKQSLWITFNYASFVSGKVKARKVIPLLLKEYRNRWYLISFDGDKQDYITYALDRIDDLEITSEQAEKPKGFEPDNYFKYAVGITSGNETPQKVVFEANTIAAKYIHSQPFHASQKVITTTANSVTFELVVNVSEELIRDFMSYGGDIKILNPIELKTEVKRRAQAILS